MPPRKRSKPIAEAVEAQAEAATDPATEFNPAELEAQAPQEAPPEAQGGEPGEPAKTGRERPRGPGRPWTERYEQPVAYRRFTLKDHEGREQILFQVALAPGETKPPEEVVEAFRAHRYWKDGEAYGLAADARNNEESYSTGLQFGSNNKYPKAWALPATEFGRDVADSLDRALEAVARRLVGEPGPRVG